MSGTSRGPASPVGVKGGTSPNALLLGRMRAVPVGRVRRSRPCARAPVAQSPAPVARSVAAAFSNPVAGTGAGERMADHGGWVAEVVDAFAGFDVVEELLVPHGVGEMGERFGDA